MWEAIRANKRRSVALIFGLALLLIALGYVIGLAAEGYVTGRVAPRSIGALTGVVVAAFVWLMLWLTALMSGRRILLSSAGAREITKDDYPVVFNVVEEMTIAAGLPKMPRIYVIDNNAPNAFAVGTREEAAVAVTTGLLMRLNRDELQGVVAHEIGHITNNDTKFMVLAGVMVAAIVILADVFLRSVFYSGRGRRRSRGKGGGGGAIVLVVIALVFAVLAPFLAQLLYFACSRRREFLADACSARFTRYPAGLASALQKISSSAAKMEGVNRAVAPMFTVNPLKAGGAASLWSTHPPTAQRVQVLRAMGNAAYAEYEKAFEQIAGERLIGERTLQEADSAPIREPSEEQEKSGMEKAREAVDMLHRMDGFLFLSCVCGLKTKVPPSYERDEIRCPRCGRVVPIPRAAMLAAAGAAAVGGGSAAQQQANDGRARPSGRQEPLVVQREAGTWQSFRCSCGSTVQLSPSFSASQIRCRSCGRRIEVR